MIVLGHGAGGRLSHALVEEHFLPRFANPELSALLDSAVLDDLALSTDAYVVTPRFFPGGDLGRLAVCGTVNDLCMVGATPLALTAAFILEEGLPLLELDRLTDSMARAAEEAAVKIVAGDTKVVPRGACDGAFITTTGIGRMDPAFAPRPDRVNVGDAVLVSGTLGDHGMAVMAARDRFCSQGDLCSDVAPLNGLVAALRNSGIGVHALRDPTRGGLAQTVIEIASAAGVRIVIEEQALPVRPSVRAACELLGLEPLFVANEGKLVAWVAGGEVAEALAVLRRHPLGKRAAVIGRVEDGPPGCELQTQAGGRRTLRMASGELLPRIC